MLHKILHDATVEHLKFFYSWKEWSINKNTQDNVTRFASPVMYAIPPGTRAKLVADMM